MTYTQSLQDAAELSPNEIGGKASGLAKMLAMGVRVPNGFVVLGSAFSSYIEKAGLLDKILELGRVSAESERGRLLRRIRDAISTGTLSYALRRELNERLDALPGERYVVRSSAVSEDSTAATFAGIHESFLNIEGSEVAKRVLECWTSVFSSRAISYRIRQSIGLNVVVGVVVQVMKEAEVSGVAFTVHPFKRDCMLFEASFGLGDIVVAGVVTPDTYVVDRATKRIVDYTIGSKDRMSVCGLSGVELRETPADIAAERTLDDRTLEGLAELCLRLEDSFGRPQDVEWCIAKGQAWILQTRPIVEV